MAKADLTAARLRELLHYNPETGVFMRRAAIGRTGRTIPLIEPISVGAIDYYGYVSFTMGRYRYKAHRLAWLYVHGEWPSHDVDHINGVKSDNRMVNLRDVTRSGNSQNRRNANASNQSSLLGVGQQNGRYRARIDILGKSVFLGNFDTPDLAHDAYVAAKRKLHSTCTI